ncbi:MAG: succinylglutamate desuccinylase/aspartoacylase family protein [Planctomycetes bacterium]|nr:succinylglutamate desuccinylase/aspartoacylase family protein [Planctomycetota bacterium]
MNDVRVWGDKRIELGQHKNIDILVSRSYSGATVKVPVQVWIGKEPGPTAFISGAVHGDEINGTGLIRQIILERPFVLRRGALILVPVVNVFGFEQHSRYLPDRRDLNRCFPGKVDGSLASRLAEVIFREIVGRSDFGIDLHTAAIRRTNFPNVRADMSNPDVAELAQSFGSELIVDAEGPAGALRREACKRGCPTIIVEAGEVWKVEPAIVEYLQRGVMSVLAARGMIDGQPHQPAYRTVVRKATWVRADSGGFLQFHVAPGDILSKGQPIATNTSLRGREQNVLFAPKSGIVIGMTTLPSVAPGDPVCHLAVPEGGLDRIRKAVRRLGEGSLLASVKETLATSILVSSRDEEPPADESSS